MTTTAAPPGPPAWLRWLAVPMALLVVGLAALAIGTESRSDFIDRIEAERAAEREAEAARSAQQGEGQPVPLAGDRVVLETPNGSIELSLDGSSVVATDGEGSTSVLTLTPDPNGDIVGFRVGEDGTIQPVRAGESLEGATLIVPNEDGSVSLIRPDGSLVQLTPGPDGITAREWNADATSSRQIEPDSDGRLDLGDGLFVDAVPEADDAGTSDIDWRTIGIIVLALLGLAGALWWFFYFKPRGDEVADDAGPPPVWTNPDLDPWDAFETYLQGLLADPDPTHAIRLVFAYAEQGIGRLPARHPEETPYEWYGRVAGAEPDLAVLLWPLSERYSAIRFGRHEATGAERDTAVEELRALAHASCREPARPGRL